ncbi:MAG: MBL fold metallo-hydrolase [Planctomycetia bacterium]|nr:MBL fold metallo-hydrolase [Planctomycetia bacterium]
MSELRNNIFSVGAVDWNVRDFHSFDTKRGATYNAYLVQDEKNALIDAVKAPFAETLFRNISEKTELEKINYVVCNHCEPDHSGALPEVMKRLTNATLLCNAKCKDVLAAHYDIADWKIQIVGPTDRISLGTRSMMFLNTPMVHWPESMMTYIPEEKILFSNDAFGQHLATSVRFDDQWDLPEIMREAKAYYANIVTPYGRQVLKTLEAAKDLPLEMIAPSHGLIWRKNLGTILSAYSDWASGRYSAKVLILYDTMWESTKKMAEEIAKGAISVSSGLDVQPIHIRKTSLTRIATELLDTPVIAVGSATLNTLMMPMMGAVLTYIKGLKFRSKSAVSFGSAGWGPGGPESIAKWLEEMNYPLVAPMIKSKFLPTPEVLDQCFQTGITLGKLALEKAKQNE